VSELRVKECLSCGACYNPHYDHCPLCSGKKSKLVEGIHPSQVVEHDKGISVKPEPGKKEENLGWVWFLLLVIVLVVGALAVKLPALFSS
jgi:uncharacterized OB-fold protein